jgi:hypothetical protein
VTKSDLLKLLESAHPTYNERVARVESEGVVKKWGMGVGEPLSIEPYRMEILGIKPGRFLDAAPKKIAKNRYCYYFDATGRVLGRKEYSEPSEAATKAWIVFWEFYDHIDGQILRYSYGSALDGLEDTPTLQRVACVRCEDGRVVRVGELLRKRLEYTEIHYSYEEEEIRRIDIVWPEMDQRRILIVQHNADRLTIVEETPDGPECIYPE